MLFRKKSALAKASKKMDDLLYEAEWAAKGAGINIDLHKDDEDDEVKKDSRKSSYFGSCFGKKSKARVDL